MRLYEILECQIAHTIWNNTYKMFKVMSVSEVILSYQIMNLHKILQTNNLSISRMNSRETIC